MNNWFMAVAETESYSEILSMESVVEYINMVTMALEFLIVVLCVYQIVASLLARKLGQPESPYFHFTIHLVVTILWGWIMFMNEAIFWAKPNGETDIIMCKLAPIAFGLSAIVTFLRWVQLKRLSQIAGRISLVIADTTEAMAENQERNNQPFISPYRIGDGTGEIANVSRETKAVVAGCNA